MEANVAAQPDDALPNSTLDADLLWVGSTDGMEQALIERAKIPYRGIETGKLRGINPLAALRNAGRMIKGLRQSMDIVRNFRPDVCLVTGGYVCVPVVMACRLLKVPVLIYLPDMAPGGAIRLLSKLAQRVAVSFPAVAPYFGGEHPQGKAVVTGYPVRHSLIVAAQDHAASRARLARALERPTIITEKLPLVLIWGGSQGARSINQATWANLPALLAEAQIVHAVGERDWPLFQQHLDDHPLPASLSSRYHPVAYLHEEMVDALAAADVTVARAGASTLGEFPVARLPSILVPLPFAGVNQVQNAQALTSQRAAVVLEDNQLEKLPEYLLELLHDKPKLNAMEDALAQIAQPQAAKQIVDVLAALVPTQAG